MMFSKACRLTCASALLAILGGGVLMAQGPPAPPWAQEFGLKGGPGFDHYFILKAPADLMLDSGELGGGSLPQRRMIERLNAEYGVVSVSALHRSPPCGHRDPARFSALGLDRMWLIVLDGPRDDLDQVMSRYAAVQGVERVWRDGPISGGKTPDDPLWSSQWNLQSSHVDSETMWDTWTGETVTVAVVDSGCDQSHPDLKNNLWVNLGEIAGNGKDDDLNGYIDDVHGWDFENGDNDPDDDCGHGSHVAGIIGAQGDNARDVAGICWSARIMSVKVLRADASGSWATIAQGMVYAVDNGAVVSNYSIGGDFGDPAVEAAVQYAASLDVVQVAAAGNKASTTPYYPAAYDGVIAVMASDSNDKRLAWSNHGPWCDLCAPGDIIYSLWKGGLTNVLSGTSMASPHVAGVAAMVRTLNPQLDRTDVELAIETGADDLGASGPDSEFGFGRVNALESAVRAGLLTMSKTSASPGDTVDLYLTDAAHPYDIYLIEPTLSGRDPGYSLDTLFPNDFRVVPLNPDWVTALSNFGPDVGVFDKFFGALDSNGQAIGAVNLPNGRGLIGQEMAFVALTFGVADLSSVRRVTNSIALDIQ